MNMFRHPRRTLLPIGLLGLLMAPPQSPAQKPAAGEKRLLYVASPGIRNYVEHGGVGVLVFDIDEGYRFVRRIPTWDVPEGHKPENVKGIAASARTGRIFVSTINRMMALDAVTGKKVWDKTYEGGCDRMSISPDGRLLYVPQFEGPFWHVVNASNGNVIAKIETKSASHNTVYAPDGSRVYMAGLKSPVLSIADPRTHTVTATVGPFASMIRPFTVNGSTTLVFVNINGLLGFEVGDVRTGRKLHRVEVQGYQQGKVKRHGCPSHGIAMTPDEKEIWVVDGANYYVHVFDATVMPPSQTTSIKLRDSPGWISFSMDGRHAYSSTGEVIDAASKEIVAALKDETGRDVQSEKLLDVVIANGKVVRAGNQFGVGMKLK
jgi:DNA-binding beta-propeller fold protein YncE